MPGGAVSVPLAPATRLASPMLQDAHGVVRGLAHKPFGLTICLEGLALLSMYDLSRIA
jgi:hypothetical protein